MLEADRLAEEYQSIANVVIDGTSRENRTLPGVRNIQNLAEHCKSKSHDLLDLLQELRVDPNQTGASRIFRSLQKAVKTQRKRKSIERDCKFLENINSQLSMEFLILLRTGQLEQNDLFQTLIRAIEENHEDSIRTVLAARDDICQAVAKSNNNFSQSIPSEPAAGPMNSIVAYRQQLKIQFVGSLLFPEIDARRDAVAPAYEATFDWALTDDSLGLRQWLSNQSGIYWISGKAGSGKSTLMRHLAQSNLTKSLLDEWADLTDSDLVVAEFYFWYAGTRLQKSIEGLLRGLLFQILNYCDGAEQIAFPLHWQRYKDYQRADMNLSRYELTHAINRLAAACERRELMHDNSRCRFCFFIDGLDEYKGNLGELISLLKNLTRGKQIKVCASSRPWNPFRSAFEGSYPSLKLEDLTRSDITQYVRGNLLSTVSDMNASDQDALPPGVSPSLPSTIQDITRSIVERAEGVFLWVELVVKSVQEGLWEGDQADFLYQRVASFPEDLDAFFRQVLDRVDVVYRQTTAMILQLAYSYTKDDGMAWSASDFTEFWLIRDHARLIATDPEFAQNIDVQLCNNQQLQKMEAQTRTFLNACCKDLMHIPKPADTGHGTETLMKRVEFLHRTVFDFLTSDEMQTRLAKDLPKAFGSSHTFRQMALARCKVICVDEPNIAETRFNDAALYQFSVVDEPMITRYYHLGMTYQQNFSQANDGDGLHIRHHRVRDLFAAFGCTKMITEDRRYVKMAIPGDFMALLIAAFGLHYLRTFPIEYSDAELVDYLLQIGARPCLHIWKRFLRQWMDYDRRTRSRKTSTAHSSQADDVSRRLAQTAITMLRQNVRLNCLIYTKQDLQVRVLLNSAETESARIDFLRRTLSEHLDRSELERSLSAAKSIHAADTYLCGRSEIHER